MKKTLLSSALIVTLCSSPVLALTFRVFEAGDSDNINGWINGGQITVLEDFEGINVDGEMDWYQSLDTGVGVFTSDGSNIGTGDTSYNANNPDSQYPFFSIQNRTNSWYGRYDTTDTGDSSQWLDSGDIDSLTLNLVQNTFSSLFFYIQDASDVGATTTLGTNITGHSYSFNSESNGSSYFVGIRLGQGETLSQINWVTTTQSDGFGLDDFSTVASPVPEPATMLLFGAGLIGLAGVARRRK